MPFILISNISAPRHLCIEVNNSLRTCNDHLDKSKEKVRKDTRLSVLAHKMLLQNTSTTEFHILS